MTVQAPSLNFSDDFTALSKQHYENFPVARFVKKKCRKDIQAIYAFARMADDFADEPEYAGKRLECLAYWREQLYACQHTTAQLPLFVALAKTLKETQLPIVWLDQLLHAFEYDVKHPRHPNFESLIEYAKLSANPVGRCVLFLHGYRDQNVYAQSDALCTALQLTNFWQDVAVDAKRQRFYIPQNLLAQYQCSEHDLIMGQESPALAELLEYLCQQTWIYYDRARPLAQALSFPLALEVKLTQLGGQAILKKIKQQSHAVLKNRPALSKWEFILLGLQAVFQKGYNAG